MFILLFVAMAWCAAGLVISIFRIYNEGIHGFLDALQSPLLVAICIFAIAFIISVLAKSQYVVTDKHYISQFGFVKSRFLFYICRFLDYNTVINRRNDYIVAF